MLTQFFQAINWVDVVIAVCFIRVVFISLPSGFIAETFKFFGTITALFVGFHFYAPLAKMWAKNGVLPVQNLKFLVFTALVVIISIAFKFMWDAILLVFKLETTHQGFDRYGAAFLGALRGWLVCGLVFFAALLIPHTEVHRQAMSSWSSRVVAQAAPQTYSFLFRHVIGKLFQGLKFNEGVFAVIGGENKV